MIVSLKERVLADAKEIRTLAQASKMDMLAIDLKIQDIFGCWSIIGSLYPNPRAGQIQKVINSYIAQYELQKDIWAVLPKGESGVDLWLNTVIALVFPNDEPPWNLIGVEGATMAGKFKALFSRN